MKHVGNENSFSVFRSVIITTQEVTTDENAFSQTYNEFVTVNVVIKTFKPSVCPTSKRSFWEDVLQTFCRLCHDDLAKLVLKYVILNQTAIDNLSEIPILFDLTVRDEAEIVGILKELKLVCSTKLLKYSRNSALLDTKKLETIFWDPTDLTKSINNLPNPGKWCQRTSTSVIHVVGACASWINAPEGYEIHRPERVPREEGHKGTTTDVSADGGGGGFKVIYYSDSFFESNFFPSHGDIILLYPGNYYCGWQVRSIFVVPSVELYGVNNGIHELDVVGTSRYSELCSTDGGLLDVGSSFYQPFPIYNIFANLTVRSRQDGRPISVRGAEVHLLLFNCCLKTAHFPAILFSPSSVGTLLMRRCFVSGAMDSCLVLGKASDISAVQHIDISLKDCKITKSGRGYLTKRGHSPAISILTVSSLEIEGCVVRDNVGHAFQMRAPKHRRPNKLTLKGNVLKRNQACDSLSLALTRTTKSTHGHDDSGSKYDMKKQANECCKYRPASPNATVTSFSSTSVAGGSSGVPGHHQQPESKEDGSLVVRGRYCFQCGQPAQKICGHCRNAFYCNVQCQLQHWGSQSDETGGCVGGHRRYCVK